jgi:hypothetical protein
MEIFGINNIFIKKDKKEILRDKYKNISLCLSLASGYILKDKVNSCIKLIAQELLDFFDNEGDGYTYPVLVDNFYRITIDNNKIYFRKNNTFGEETLNKEAFLKQKLIFVENHNIPQFLLEEEKEKMQKLLSPEESIELNKAYNKQELNSNKYYLDDIYNSLELQNILAKTGYYDISIKDYLLNVSNNDVELKISNKLFQDIYVNYILELGSYIAKKIK